MLPDTQGYHSFVNLMNVDRVQNGVPQNVTRYQEYDIEQQSDSKGFPVAEIEKMPLEKTYTSTVGIFW